MSLILAHVLTLISVEVDFHCVHHLPKEGASLELGISQLSTDMRLVKYLLYYEMKNEVLS